MIIHHTYSDASPVCKGELWLPEKPVTADTPKIMLIHGGGWWHGTADFMAGVADRFCREGYIVFNIDYRVTTEAPWPACGDDCLAAADFFVRADAEEIRVTAGKPMVVCGVSAGGHLALMTGLRMPREQVLGIISIAGIADPEPDAAAFPGRCEKLFAGGPVDPQAFPAPYLRKDSPPILLTHCLNDVIVPRESAYNFARLCVEKGADIRTYLYDRDRRNEGHAIWIPGVEPHTLYPDIAEAVAAFVRDVLGRPQPLPHNNPGPWLGKLRTLPAQEISGSPVSIGMEMLDRDLYEPAMCYDALQAAGLTHARLQTGWNRCETQKGVYTFEWLDEIVDNLLRRGIQPWFSVGYGNPLYMPDTAGTTAVGHVPLYYGEECLQAWKQFCYALADHFKGRVSQFEIWNECNFVSFWQPKKPNADDYAQLLELTQAEIRRAQPDAVCGACLAAYRSDYHNAFARLKTGIDKLQFLSIHAYTPLPEKDYTDSIHYLQRQFQAHGNGHIRLWQGESGFPHWTPKDHWLPRIQHDDYAAQANWILRRIILDVSLEMELTSIFTTSDVMKRYEMGNKYIEAFEMARYGILNGLCYTRKPAHRALANATTLFRLHPRPCNVLVVNNLRDGSPFVPGNSHLEDVSIRYQGFVRDDGQLFVTYYMPVNVEHDYPVYPDAVFSVHEEPGIPQIRQPVLINLYTGDVYRLEFERDPDAITIYGMPISSFPLVIADESILP